MNTLVSIHKPPGPTSHDVVDQLRKITGERRIGHAGTLDPLAEGVLVVGIGREATKQLRYILEVDKEYNATVRLGVTSTTDDEEGEKTEHAVSTHPTEDRVRRVLNDFLGDIQQLPPTFSAVKAGGAKAYESARKGKNPKIGPRAVSITEIEVLSYAWPELRIRVVCGSGTYIRSLARDIGTSLGTGGYLTKLVRTRVGNFSLDQARSIESFSSRASGQT